MTHDGPLDSDAVLSLDSDPLDFEQLLQSVKEAAVRNSITFIRRIFPFWFCSPVHSSFVVSVTLKICLEIHLALCLETRSQMMMMMLPMSLFK
ncbi:hypothetical protein CDAR_194691 [Caerostris darwini]|uniref:Uncharacterized protein n=1 Tax=Caerostris darwini TaxID=1538125 RepID=A0AAV4X6D8_9ARAC|nr:hypothetical protein CDAR_194691 [Caerostris darwini]